jgi:hypothetical protein
VLSLLQELSRCCSDRLDTFGKWIGIATLRSLDVSDVPEDLQAEPVNREVSKFYDTTILIFRQELILRVLYRLRSLSEQTPLDPATFSYASPLLLRVIQKGGFGSDEGDEPLEQVALSLDIIKFHCGECTFVCLISVCCRPSQYFCSSHGPCLPAAPSNPWIATCHAHSAETK